jgi:hypothetical protein
VVRWFARPFLACITLASTAPGVAGAHATAPGGRERDVYRAVTATLLGSRDGALCPFILLDDGTGRALRDVLGNIPKQWHASLADDCNGASMPLGQIRWAKPRRAYVPFGWGHMSGRCSMLVTKTLFGGWPPHPGRAARRVPGSGVLRFSKRPRQSRRRRDSIVSAVRALWFLRPGTRLSGPSHCMPLDDHGVVHPREGASPRRQ